MKLRKSNKRKTILVTGGGGYIGTNTIYYLLKAKYNVVVIDDFSNSKTYHINFLNKKFKNNIKIYEGDFGNKELLNSIFFNNKIDIVIHLAGKKYIPESSIIPNDYILNNVTKTQTLLDKMQEFKIKKIIFSSSITVYGIPQSDLVDEYNEIKPLSVYAKTKVEGENLIKDWAKKTKSEYVILRLSNPIGANKKFGLFDDSDSKYKNLLSYIVENARLNKELIFNGNNHNTKDGTTIRDYVYVKDVAKAFYKSLYLSNCVINIGAGNKGNSVLEITHTVQRFLHKKINYSFGTPREGDAPKIICNNQKAKSYLKIKFNKSLSTKVKSYIKSQTALKRF